MNPVVVVDDVSPVVRTGDVDRVRDRGSGVVCVPKTQQPVLFAFCVGEVNGIAEKPACKPITGIYNSPDTSIFCKQNTGLHGISCAKKVYFMNDLPFCNDFYRTTNY